MTFRAGIWGLTLLGGWGLLAAEEPAAPLENTRQELRAMEKDKARPGDESSAGKGHDLLPQLQMPASGSESLSLESPEKARAALQKKKEANKNWLVDGVTKLEKNSTTRTARKTAESATSADEDKPEPGDADYLLKLYHEQEKKSDAKNAAPLSAVPARNDPLKPFLQGWLSDSPVRGKFFDDYVRKSDAGPDSRVAPSSTTLPPGGGGNQSLSGWDLGNSRANDGRTALPAVNPYLQGLETSDLADHSRSPTAAATSQPALVLPPSIPTAAAPVIAPAEQKQPLWVPSDEKKYFPQLKKF
jgi:hypothetical protein